MTIAKWKTGSVFDGYNIVSESDLRDAAGTLGWRLRKLKRPRTRPLTVSSPSGEHDPIGCCGKNAGVAELADARDSKSRALHWA